MTSGHSIEDFFPTSTPAAKLRIKHIPVPPADAVEPEPEDLEAALAPAVELLANKPFAVLTGAGISTDSGLPDYRSPGSAPRSPMTLQQFMSSPDWRRHYWARNHVGWRRAAAVRPNAGHHALVHLERAGLITGVITQNVDMLHVRAGSHRVVHLHGRYDRVRCTACGSSFTRREVDERLEQLNPGWLERHVRDAETAPDADAAITETSGFTVADCPDCGGILRTDVVFFGGSVPRERTLAADAILDEAWALLVAGTSLSVGSSMRLVRAARREGKPIVIINRGPTRADDVASVRVPASTSAALPLLANRLITG